MVRHINKADQMAFKALQRAVAEDKLHLCLINSRINVPGSPIYNPWEAVLPILCPVFLGLLLIWAIGVLLGLAFMVVGIMLSSNLVKKEMERRLLERAKMLLVADYESCCSLWNFGGIVLVLANDKKQGCIAPEGNWKEFVILHFADYMTDKKAEKADIEADNEKAA